MKKFVKKLVFHSFLLSIATVGIILVRYVERTHQAMPDLRSLPTNFISNSVCFNAKLDHARQGNRFLSAKTLIMGSSMGLNNISGDILTKTFGDRSYNFSSWGFKPHETYQVLKQMEGKLSAQRLIIPFNNTEFLNDAKQIDYKGVYDHFFVANMVSVLHNFFTNFSIDSFVKDWSFRTKYIYFDNAGFTLKFAEDGSVPLRPKNFIRPLEAKGLIYYDTTGFSKFSRSLDSISRYCDRNHIELTFVYLPWRKDILTPERIKQVQYVSTYLTAKHHDKFVNLSRLAVDDHDFVDVGHMFQGGAATVTNALVDSLTTRKTIANLRKQDTASPRNRLASL
ncbi:hypothetical protein [Spirosoma agri]|uniref:SGNH/GDSL hydrolase family protein n=1 Tax=Spirosoma agri TaxID=1987381 RepID=A0A6M0IQU7_9BACT|nr:hypothetical protein [Spirosoma agri]NEU69323.1 hypothetical protein [Spirosoma agri]